MSIYLYLFNTQVGTSVRCLVWRGEGEVLVGCLDGLVHRWNVGAEPKVLFAMEGSIIHMRWNHTNKVVYHSILQYITVYHSRLQYTTVYYIRLQVYHSILQYTTAYYSIPQYVTVDYKFTTVYYSIPQYVTVYHSMLQYTTVCYSIFWTMFLLLFTSLSTSLGSLPFHCTLKFLSTTHVQCLAVGTSKGVLGVYDMSRDFPCPQAVFTAHPPKKGRQDLQFGQLTRQ